MLEGIIIIFTGISIFVLVELWVWSYSRRKGSKRLPIFITIGFVSIFILILGNYHIVLDTQEGFIKRPYFGFSDIIGEIDTCTEIPYFVAISQHASLCRALQKAGYLESEEARESRIKKEVEAEIKETEKQVQERVKKETEKTRECINECEKFSNAYSKCIQGCDDILNGHAYSECMDQCDMTSDNYVGCINRCSDIYSKKYSRCLDGCKSYNDDYSKCTENCYY